MRIDADPRIGEFGHVGAADHDEAGTPQPRHHRRIGFRRRRIVERARAGARHLAFDVEQILDRNRNPGIGRRGGLDRAQPVHRFRRFDRGLRIDMNEGPRAFARRVCDPGQAFIDKLAGAAPVRAATGPRPPEQHLLNGIRALRFTDLRFRPEVQLSLDDLKDYYNTMAEQWRRANPAQVPTFEASRDQIEKLLTDQRVIQALDRWLGTTRSETEILYKEEVFK